MRVMQTSSEAMESMVGTSLCQRWKRGREHYRPAGEVFDTSRAEVSVIDQASAATSERSTRRTTRSFAAARAGAPCC